MPRDYWEVQATSAAAANSRGMVRRERQEARRRADARATVWTSAGASDRDACVGKPGEVSEESRPTTQIAPLLYDLTSLQREANGRFGFSARTTLSLAQALYEKHKALTYPRTDARALPEDYLDTVRSTMEMLGESTTGVEARVYPEAAAAATLTRSVAEAAAREGWQLDEIHTEEGRLDEVFRTITLPDTVKAAA